MIAILDFLILLATILVAGGLGIITGMCIYDVLQAIKQKAPDLEIQIQLTIYLVLYAYLVPLAIIAEHTANGGHLVLTLKEVFLIQITATIIEVILLSYYDTLPQDTDKIY